MKRSDPKEDQSDLTTSNAKGMQGVSRSNTSSSEEVSSETERQVKYPASCLACRRRKIKCDRVLPCFSCSKKGVECTYPEKFRSVAISRILENKSAAIANMGIENSTNDTKTSSSHSPSNELPVNLEDALKKIEQLTLENKTVKNSLKSEKANRKRYEQKLKLNYSVLRLNVEVYKDNFCDFSPLYNVHSNSFEYILKNKLCVELPSLHPEPKRNFKIIETLLERFFSIRPYFVKAKRYITEYMKIERQNLIMYAATENVPPKTFDHFIGATMVCLACLFILKSLTNSDLSNLNLSNENNYLILQLYSRFNFAKPYIPCKFFKLESTILEIEMNINELTVTKSWSVFFETISYFQEARAKIEKSKAKDGRTSNNVSPADSNRVSGSLDSNPTNSSNNNKDEDLLMINDLDDELKAEYFTLIKLIKAYYYVQCVIFKRPIIEDCFPQTEISSECYENPQNDYYTRFLDILYQVNSCQLELEKGNKSKEEFNDLRKEMLSLFQRCNAMAVEKEEHIHLKQKEFKKDCAENDSKLTKEEIKKRNEEHIRKIFFFLISLLTLNYVSVKIAYTLSDDIDLFLSSTSRFFKRIADLFQLINTQSYKCPSPYSILMFRDCFICYNTILHMNPVKLLPHRGALKLVIRNVFDIIDKISGTASHFSATSYKFYDNSDDGMHKLVLNMPDEYEEYEESDLDEKLNTTIQSNTVCNLMTTTYSNTAKVLQKLEALAANRVNTKFKKSENVMFVNREITGNTDLEQVTVALSNDEICLVNSENRIAFSPSSNHNNTPKSNDGSDLSPAIPKDEVDTPNDYSLFGSLMSRNATGPNKVSLFPSYADTSVGINLNQVINEMASLSNDNTLGFQDTPTAANTGSGPSTSSSIPTADTPNFKQVLDNFGFSAPQTGNMVDQLPFSKPVAMNSVSSTGTASSSLNMNKPHDGGAIDFLSSSGFTPKPFSPSDFSFRGTYPNRSSVSNESVSNGNMNNTQSYGNEGGSNSFDSSGSSAASVSSSENPDQDQFVPPKAAQANTPFTNLVNSLGSDLKDSSNYGIGGLDVGMSPGMTGMFQSPGNHNLMDILNDDDGFGFLFASSNTMAGTPIGFNASQTAPITAPSTGTGTGNVTGNLGQTPGNNWM